MKVPVEWLKDFVTTNKSVSEIAERLSLSGNNVEQIIKPFPLSGPILAGKIINIQKHPDADKLVVCEVEIGNEKRNIITGDLTVKVNDIIPVALDGAILANGMKIERRKMRGVISEGMMCSLEELGLEEKSESVYRFEDQVPVGTDVVKYLKLDDETLDIEITPNRPDCLSIIGIARELSALFNIPLSVPENNYEKMGKCDVSVTIESEGCWRYVARVVRNVKIGESPLWLKRRLISAGIRPINNIVDITNYVMLETGHPVHAFDLNMVGNKIIVRNAKKGEKILLLDEKEYEMKGGEILITNGEKILALGGIMGGELTGVKETTTDLLLEVAMFDPVQIRKAAKQHGLMTESSYRFERGVDPDDALFVMERLSTLIYEIAGGVSSEVLDVYSKRVEPGKIIFQKQLIENVIGVQIPEDISKAILQNLGFKVLDRDEKTWEICVPTFRYFDIERPIDIVEEVGRIYGYDSVESTPFRVLVGKGGRTREQRLRSKLRELMVSQGFSEAITLSFISEKIHKCWGISKNSVPLLNPINEDMNIMRPTLLYGLMESLSYNYKRQNRDVKIFEIGNVFIGAKEQPENVEKIAGVAVGRINKYDYTDNRKFNFYIFKGILDNISKSFGVKFSYEDTEIEGFVPTQVAAVILNGKRIGFIGMLEPDFVNKVYDVKDEVFVFELSTKELYENYIEVPEYKASVIYPGIRRDIAFLIPSNFKAGILVEEFEKSKIVEEAGIADIYKGKGIPEGFTSVTFYAVFRSQDKTLNDEEVNKEWENIKQNIINKYPVKVRFEGA
ncbi:phenylalanine--tRNA ligase subunit beta [Thermosipho ferrireducens]|uniref:Phenylalanine--tRNA ligase beta subunit n=1 Tax=Thermosipho ferrireducens TaxID=2571116 RepID=A0ABX7S618_9BACT|nr:phenylalanine--tRNA ligase subunit beta [Thermosipho ferrireducens]QTA37266.1 phenylalanine--tRNA ligase subunit beta [Thermosipho ferrireducens]